jgi:hypothetical protein
MEAVVASLLVHLASDLGSVSKLLLIIQLSFNQKSDNVHSILGEQQKHLCNKDISL